MNSVQRVHAALRLEQPDRVPIVEFLVDEKIARAVMPDVLDVPDFMDRMGLDAIGTGARFDVLEESAENVEMWGSGLLGGGTEALHIARGPIKTFDVPSLPASRPDAPHRLRKLRQWSSATRESEPSAFITAPVYVVCLSDGQLATWAQTWSSSPSLTGLLMDKVLEVQHAVVRNAIAQGRSVSPRR